MNYWKVSFTKYKSLVGFILVLLLIACQEDHEVSVEDEGKEVSIMNPFLPMKSYPLEDLSGFSTKGDNWKIVGDVISDFSKVKDRQLIDGSGVLVNIADGDEGKNIITTLEHGDIEMEIDIMVPKGSNSGLYFQSRYELQIRDSAEDDDVSSDDMGGIYSSKEGEKGIAPLVNASRAPGLWQNLKVFFRAPVFDDSGKKVSNAMFSYVYLNGFLIHKDVEVSAPTLGAVSTEEVVKAPLLIQGDHGPVAFKNFKYKTYEQDKVELTDLTYQLYTGTADDIPDFSELQPANSGAMENFDDLETLTGEKENYSLQIEGTLTVPRDGEYLIETSVDDGADVYIDGQLVVPHIPDVNTNRMTTVLTAGSHEMRMEYYQVTWNASIKMMVEGPQIEKHEIPLRSEPREIPSWAKKRELIIEVGNEPELIRGFHNHDGVKKTHVLAVGTNKSVHYSFDTRNNQLLNVWKGEFANVGEMWINRGQSQLLEPMNAVLELPLNEITSEMKPTGYSLDSDGIPIFAYDTGDGVIQDKTVVTDEGSVRRTLSIDDGAFEYDIANGDVITQLSDDWYSVDGKYYVKIINGDEGSFQRDKNSPDKLTTTIRKNENLTYEIKW